MKIKSGSNTNAVKSDSLVDLKHHHLRCRVFGHAWDVADSTIVQVTDGRGRKVWQTVVVCGCGTKRIDEIDQRTFEIAGRQYEYPDGYLMTIIVSRVECRLEWVARRINLGGGASKR